MTIADAKIGSMGHLIHSQVHANDRFSNDCVAAYYIRNLINYALGNSSYAYVQPVDLSPVSPILSIDPVYCDVGWQENLISLEVTNVGVGTMNWTAEVVEGGSWLSIVSGANGVNNGTIRIHIDQNTSKTDSRTAKIQIVASDVEGSPMVVTVVQTTQPNILGDANGDGLVDVGDLGILAANYGSSGKKWAQGDFNGDGWVDVGDLGILAANYGTNASNTDWAKDYEKTFGTTVVEEDSPQDINSQTCSGFGLPAVTGLILMGLLLVKLEE
jgi:uncharacterized protein (DUF2141 family)